MLHGRGPRYKQTHFPRRQFVRQGRYIVGDGRPRPIHGALQTIARVRVHQGGAQGTHVPPQLLQGLLPLPTVRTAHRSIVVGPPSLLPEFQEGHARSKKLFVAFAVCERE